MLVKPVQGPVRYWNISQQKYVYTFEPYLNELKFIIFGSDVPRKIMAEYWIRETQWSAALKRYFKCG